ncbi:MAG: ABC transporter permease subunit [Betaproteobacteria bacterium]|nr:ABC transporter permease subunit [Betaproteobacteria bacterium]MDE2047692.1 ABC transporter permease subunit [Betaproteobacteria bacterium]
MAVSLLMVAVPFVWRSFETAVDCIHQSGCGALFEPLYLRSVVNTLVISSASTLIALPLGLLAAYSACRSARLDSWVSVISTLGANFAGVPLALAFVLIFGVQGFVTTIIGHQALEPAGFAGLLLAYLCFQWPLCTSLLIDPLRQLDPHLKDAAASLGAGPKRYWMRVGLPLLMPSLIEVAMLLFANAAAAYATPFALAGTRANLLSVQISTLVSGDLFADPRLASLLSFVLFVILTLVLLLGRWSRASLAPTSQGLPK